MLIIILPWLISFWFQYRYISLCLLQSNCVISKSFIQSLVWGVVRTPSTSTIIVIRFRHFNVNKQENTHTARYLYQYSSVVFLFSFIKGFLTRNDPPNAYNREFNIYRNKKYVIRLSDTLPKSLIDYRWPEPPACGAEVNAIKLHFKRSSVLFFNPQRSRVQNIYQ